MPRWLIAIIGCAVLLAACGDSAAPTTTVSPATSAAPSTGDTSPALASAPELTSFRYFTTTDITVDEPAGETRFVSTKVGAHVAPDRHLVVSNLSVNGDDGHEQRLILVGAEAFYSSGEAWEAVSRDDPRAVDTLTGLTAVTADIVPNGVVELLSAFAYEMDQVGGRSARRFDLGRAEFAAITAASGQPFFQGTIDAADDLFASIWVDEDGGSIIKMTLEATGPAAMLGSEAGAQLAPSATVRFSIAVELQDVNDPSIEIDAPAIG